MKTLINTQMMTICCFFMILIGFQTSAQQSSVNPVELIETNIKVTAFAETDRFYWVGTENGVYQVKKKNGKVWHMKDNNSRLPSNKVTAICARSNGEVFIGTDKGILRYDRVTFVPVNTENAELSSNDIRALHCDKQDFVWIGTSENALSLIRYTTMHSFSKISSESMNDHILSFHDDGRNGVTLNMASGCSMKFVNGHIQKIENNIHAGM